MLFQFGRHLDFLDLKTVQERVDAFVMPSDVGRIPLKIQSGFSLFTANQWRNWTLLYSLCSLKGIIPHQPHDCWLLFVKAASLCRRSISLQQLDMADTFLIEFCETFERLYGKEHLNINTHLHRHLKECLLKFGFLALSVLMECRILSQEWSWYPDPANEVILGY